MTIEERLEKLYGQKFVYTEKHTCFVEKRGPGAPYIPMTIGITTTGIYYNEYDQDEDTNIYMPATLLRDLLDYILN